MKNPIFPFVFVVKRVDDMGSAGTKESLERMARQYRDTRPWRVNAWTLGGFGAAFSREGVAYYLFDYADLEIFADNTVYLAVYQGSVPDNATFTIDEDGFIALAQGDGGGRPSLPCLWRRARPIPPQSRNSLLQTALTTCSSPKY